MSRAELSPARAAIPQSPSQRFFGSSKRRDREQATGGPCFTKLLSPWQDEIAWRSHFCPQAMVFPSLRKSIWHVFAIIKFQTERIGGAASWYGEKQITFCLQACCIQHTAHGDSHSVPPQTCHLQQLTHIPLRSCEQHGTGC